MEKTVLISVISMLLLSGTAGKYNPSERSYSNKVYSPSSESWKKVKYSDNIYIFERWIEVDQKRKVRQLRASMTVKATAHEILSVIRDDRKASKWQCGVKSFYHLKKVNKETWYSYTLYSIPWPLNNQDVVTKYQVVNSSNSLTIKIKMTGVPDYIPEKKGVSRISHYSGNWVLTPLNNGSCKVDYYVYSKQKTNFPKWIVDGIVRKSLWKTFDNLREMIKENQ